MQLADARIPLTQAEATAVEDLLAAHPDEPISLTRRDPGEKGPVLVHVGDRTFTVDRKGQVT